jgi:hypothetical protein
MRIFLNHIRGFCSACEGSCFGADLDVAIAMPLIPDISRLLGREQATHGAVAGNLPVCRSARSNQINCSASIWRTPWLRLTHSICLLLER